MYKKLLSNLAFNPSLIGQVSFYAQRLHKEAALRRAGFVMLALAMVLQTFAVISPPQSSLQASPNTDLINGGFSTKQEAVSHCKNNTQDYKTIMNHFGISCEAIANAETTTIKPRDRDGNLYSMGRMAFGVNGETPVRVPGAGTFFVRHFWSLNHDPSYKALKGTDSQGKTFFILFGCANLVSIGIPSPPPPPVTLDVCENVPGIQSDRKECDVCEDTPGIQLNKNQCDVCPNIDGVQTTAAECDICPKKPGTQTGSTAKCDVCPNKAGVQTTASQCDVCPNVDGIQIDKAKCDVCPETTGIQTNKNQCDVCPETSGTQTSTSACDVCPAVSGTQTNTTECDLCPDKNGIQSNATDCRPCEESQTNDDKTACLVYQKSAKNVTQSIADANNTVANPGDVIEYTLTTTNKGNATIKDYHVNETLGDVLDYATVVDLHGGEKGAYEIVTWPKKDIKAGATITNVITVKVKDVLPNTPTSSTDPNHFDMVMTNVYGNAVNVKLPPSVVKQVEIATTTLPNTGPGTSLTIGFTLTVVVGYFFARSRLLAKELDIVRADFGTAGGY